MREIFRNSIMVLAVTLVLACSDKNEQTTAQGAAAEIEKLASAVGTTRGEFRAAINARVTELSQPGNKEAMLEWRKTGYVRWRNDKYQPIFDADFEELYAFGLNNLDNPSGFNALALALHISEERIDYKKIRDIHERLYENYLNTSEYGYILGQISFMRAVGFDYKSVGPGKDGNKKRYDRVVMLLNRAVENATNPVVKNHAMVALADYLGRTLARMDPLEIAALDKRRTWAEALLDTAIENTKSKSISLLKSNAISSIARYNQSLRAVDGSEKKTSKGRAPANNANADNSLHAYAKAALFTVSGLSVGRQLPKTIGVDLAGKPQDLAQYHGRVLLIDFWATWCGPCIAKFPHFRELKKQYAGRPFEILGISADDTVKIVEEFMQDNETPWDMWFSGRAGGLRMQWRAYALPTIFLIDHTGKVSRINPKIEELDTVIATLVAAAEQDAK